MKLDSSKVDSLINVCTQLIFQGKVPNEDMSWDADLIESIKFMRELEGLTFHIEGEDISLRLLLKSEGVILRTFYTPKSFYEALRQALVEWFIEPTVDIPNLTSKQKD